MTIKKVFCKYVAIILVVILFVMTLPIRPVHAVTTLENSGHQVKITSINENKVRIEENGVIEEIEVVKNFEDKIQKIISRNLTTGVDETIIINSEKHTAYSTLTNEIETLSQEELAEIKRTNVNLCAVGDKHTYKISFAKIASSADDTSTLSGIAKFIISYLGLMGVSVSNPVATIVTMISGISGIIALVAKGSSKQGLYIVTEEYMRSTTKNGKVYKYLANRIIDIGVY